MKQLFVRLLSTAYQINSTTIRRNIRTLIAKLEGGEAFSKSLRELIRYYHGFEIGIGTYGCFNPVNFNVGKGNLKVGKFTSISDGVCAYTRNHPYWFSSTHPLFFNRDFGGIGEDTVPRGNLTIGNDVWIGQYAVILPSCSKIGDGAVIGAGTIVTEDVPDYAIVAGNPGRILKFRFDEDTILHLKTIGWWDWDIEFIKENAWVFSQTVDELVKLAQQTYGNADTTAKGNR